jgi:uncharacterized protein
MAYVIVPGINGSDASHWQSHWESDLGTAARRIAPTSWDAPHLDDWLEAITQVASPGAVLVAHSLGCLAVASWLAVHPGAASGAFLVAPPDPASPAFPTEAVGFDRGAGELGVPTLMVTSSDDPYSSQAASRSVAADWRATLIEIGALGHVNAASGIGDWPEGRRLLTAFTAGLDRGTRSADVPAGL